MGIFSLDWWRSEKAKELESLRIEREKLEIEQIRKHLDYISEGTLKTPTAEYTVLPEKPYKSVKLINDVLTIVLNDGSILSKPNSTEEDFNNVRKATNEEQLFKIGCSSEALEEKKKKEAEFNQSVKIANGISILRSNSEFVVEDNSVYMKGVQRSLPQLLVEKFAQVLSVSQELATSDDVSEEDVLENDEEYQALKNFWLKCCLNPNAKSAEDLYEFLTHHNFKIDRHGNFYAYRRVVSKGSENKALVEFIADAYNKVKAVWKKRCGDYWVHMDEDTKEFSFSKHEYSEFNDLGNLEELYLDLPNMQEKSYTSKHTGKEDYRIGEVVSMPRNDGDDDNGVSCSKGFHAASKAYNYSGFGDTPILVIINPIDVLAVPVGEVGKLRTCRWFFAMTLDEKEQFILDEEDFDVTTLGDVFEQKCLENLQNYVQNSFAEEVKRHTFGLPNISGGEFSYIIANLEKMKDVLSKRINIID